MLLTKWAPTLQLSWELNSAELKITFPYNLSVYLILINLRVGSVIM